MLKHACHGRCHKPTLNFLFLNWTYFIDTCQRDWTQVLKPSPLLLQYQHINPTHIEQSTCLESVLGPLRIRTGSFFLPFPLLLLFISMVFSLTSSAPVNNTMSWMWVKCDTVNTQNYCKLSSICSIFLDHSYDSLPFANITFLNLHVFVVEKYLCISYLNLCKCRNKKIVEAIFYLHATKTCKPFNKQACLHYLIYAKRLHIK